MEGAFRYAAAFLVIASLTPVAPARAVDVDHCGQVVARHDVGDLVVDLDCSVDVPAGTLAEISAVYLEAGARLRLNGHTLSGAHNVGVGCGSRCAVEGPGTLEGFPDGILSYGTTRIDNVAFHANPQSAIHLLGSKALRVRGVTILDASGFYAVIAHRLLAQGLTISNCFVGIDAVKLVGSDITVSGCGGRAVTAEKVRVSGLTVTDNAGIGVLAARIRLADSVLTGNDSLGTGVDLRSDRPPRLVNTICGRSERGETGESFGVCTDD